MTTPRKIILYLCALAFVLTLLRIPVIHQGYDSTRYFFDVGNHDTVRFDILAVWWVGIAIVGAFSWALAAPKR